MRQIKLRIYHECQNGHGRFLFKEIMKDSTITGWGEKNCKCPTFEFGEGFSPKAFPEQFTGLHDKNGKEIYEGDVLKSEGPINVSEKVVFESGMFCFGDRSDPLENWCYRSEIIGNIHEDIRFRTL